MGRFLRELHATDPATVAGLLPTRPAPSPHRVVAHADLGAEHILELDGTLTGIIDWSDAAITDPAVDFARLYRDFGPGFLGEMWRAHVPPPEAMPRVEFFARCAALEDLAYGRASGRREYVTNAGRSVEWLFPPSDCEPLNRARHEATRAPTGSAAGTAKTRSPRRRRT